MDRNEDDVVVIGKRGDRRLVPARFLIRFPVRVAAHRIEERGVHQNVADDPVDARLEKPLRPPVEDGVDVVSIEAPRDVGVAAPDDEKGADERPVADLSPAPEGGLELVVRAEVVEGGRRRDQLGDRGDRLGGVRRSLEDDVPRLLVRNLYRDTRRLDRNLPRNLLERSA